MMTGFQLTAPATRRVGLSRPTPTGPASSGVDLIYVGGDFEGTSQDERNGIMICDGLSQPDTSFDLALETGSIVRAITMTSGGDLCLAGTLFMTISQQQVERAGGVWDGTTLVFAVQANQGTGFAVAVDGNDNVYFGGTFHSVYNPAIQDTVLRKGVVAYTSAGAVIDWTAHVLDSHPTDDIVIALAVGVQLDPLGNPIAGLWIGGEYTGPWAGGNDIVFISPLP
jgi:hypothetical protein